MSLKSELAAMGYLAKVRPDKYVLQRQACIFRLSEWVPIPVPGCGNTLVKFHEVKLGGLTLLKGGK